MPPKRTYHFNVHLTTAQIHALEQAGGELVRDATNNVVACRIGEDAMEAFLKQHETLRRYVVRER